MHDQYRTVPKEHWALVETLAQELIEKNELEYDSIDAISRRTAKSGPA